MSVVLVLFGVAAFAAWLSAAVHGFWSLAHLSGRKSLGALLVQGIEWFNSENFTERGQVLQRRFIRSFVAFFVLVLAAVGIAALSR